MTIFQAIISGTVQGITEFFPISSSGHLVLLHSLIGLKEPQIAFDIFLHIGTLFSIFAFFAKDIISLFGKERKMLGLLALASIPTFLMALLFKDLVETSFNAPRTVGFMLITTGIWLMIASISAITFAKKGSLKGVGVVNSIVIGIAQGVAMMPGISRSGATIGTAMILGVEKEKALRFSFLLAIPAILGASIFKIKDISSNVISGQTLYFIFGGIAAAITGFFAIKALLGIIKKDMFAIFGVYCIAAGLVTIFLYRG